MMSQFESDKAFVHIWFRRRGNRLTERTARGKAAARRHLMKTTPKLFTKESRRMAGLR